MSLNFFLSDLYLLQGSELYIYNEAGTMFSGPVTKAHVYDGHYATDIISGEEVYIEAIISRNSFEEFNITFNTVVHGFDLETDRTYGVSQLCEVDVNCPAGAGWTNERDAVCKIYSNKADWCTGTMIADDCQTLRSFLLTADHCYQDAQDLTNWVFRFNYDSGNPTTPSCRGSEPTG